jgi:hypothetical protein
MKLIVAIDTAVKLDKTGPSSDTPGIFFRESAGEFNTGWCSRFKSAVTVTNLVVTD